jgi:hypothetical protein
MWDAMKKINEPSVIKGSAEANNQLVEIIKKSKEPNSFLTPVTVLLQICADQTMASAWAIRESQVQTNMS